MKKRPLIAASLVSFAAGIAIGVWVIPTREGAQPTPATVQPRPRSVTPRAPSTQAERSTEPPTAKVAAPPAPSAVSVRDALALRSRVEDGLRACEARLRELSRMVAARSSATPLETGDLLRTLAALAAVDGGALPQPFVDLCEQRANEARRADGQVIAKAVLRDALGMKEDQARWMTNYACATRDLRSSALAELKTGASGPAVLEQLLRERNRVVDDLKRFLDADTYRRFRAIGGLGLLSEAAGCIDR
jgi:hypothetical protein